MKTLFSLLLIVFVIAGCSTKPREEQTSPESQAWMRSIHEGNGDFGAYPQDYKKIIESYFQETLKDPYSARYSYFREPKKDAHLVDTKSRVALYGYSVCVNVNAKNSYGGYTGNKPYWLLIRNGEIIKTLEPTTADHRLDYFAEQLVILNCEHPNVRD